MAFPLALIGGAVKAASGLAGIIRKKRKQGDRGGKLGQEDESSSSNIMGGIDAGLKLGEGLSSFFGGRKVAKQQEKAAEEAESRALASRGGRDAMIQEGVSGARQRATGRSAGFDTAREMSEKGTALAVNKMRRGTRSSSDFLSGVSQLNQQQQEASQQLSLQDTAGRERAFDQLRQLSQVGAGYKQQDAISDANRAGELGTAAQANRANALKGLFGGFANTAKAVGNMAQRNS